MQEVKSAYQGRKTVRQGSEQRRLAILNAALRVLVRDGVRGVRHRAVAREAGVPLSATTYYFKDINDLLADAFTLFADEMMQAGVDPFWLRVNEWIRAYPAGLLHERPALIDEIVEHMATLGADYILARVQGHRQQLVLEHAFWYSALADERMHGIALLQGHRLIEHFTRILDYVGAKEVEFGARAILMTVRGLEYEGMIGSPDFDADRIKATLRHVIRAVLAV